ncbi:hypothetical protein OIU77_000535 [Salix suchowensis]|uniref:BURP domain-containing protein n=1 Tax=Salix suchowensis TaxID=1278906 RepID=A0ABQ9B6D2_9ROSI|nr:hypothetical protein OIU77_000535 [Salix suchowensis]
MAATNVFSLILFLSFSSCKVCFAATTTSSLHEQNLSAQLNPFSPRASLIQQSVGNHDQDSKFALYSNKRFASYGGSRLSGVDSFKNYSNGLNSVADSFLRYSRDSTGHSETFTNYGNDGNVANASFGNYGSGATGGSGTFNNYDNKVNVPGLRFTTYASDGNDHKLSFSSYSDETNVGAQGFNSYGKKGNGVPSEFIAYSRDSNVIESKFTGYGELGNAANDSFTGYGNSGNTPQNNFKSYGTGANSGIDSFSSYRNGANADYGKGSKGRTTIGFRSYSLDRSFVVYNDKGVTFSGYSNTSSTPSDNGGSVHKRWVEPGKFFRESMLKQGNVMVMPDIRDKMPDRSFLPRSIVSKLPFSTTNLARLKELFQASDNSTMVRVLVNALAECERVPSRGETKRCVGSVEDMIDFAVWVLGHNVTVRTTENVEGSKKKVMIGSVEGINGGHVTKSVSCHQSLYPYLLYYCHSVPRVRVYKADIVDPESKERINVGVAICHIDTSAWGPEHGAFVALGSSPGKIEVCHWIFQNDMTWTIADRA